MRQSVSNDQMKALAMATAGATLAAVATMFLPVAMLESVTGATGLSELVPAAAAPLGDTARALIAFGAGAFTMALLAYLLLRQDSSPRTPETAPASIDRSHEASSLKDRLAKIALSKMPWMKGENDITDLADLPKLRNGDSHPDAPPRRPLSAQQDLPVLDLADIAVEEIAVDEAARVEVKEIETVEEAQRQSFDEPYPMPDSAGLSASMMASEIQPTLAEMVAQLEAAVAERQSQLAELEAVAAHLGAGQVVQREPAEQVEVEERQSGTVLLERPTLEVVPASVKDDDMDSALAAALATLHRMNGTSR